MSKTYDHTLAQIAGNILAAMVTNMNTTVLVGGSRETHEQYAGVAVGLAQLIVDILEETATVSDITQD